MEGSDGPIIDPILSRLKIFSSSSSYKTFSTSQADYVKMADNREGGYGYLVCIHASNNA